MKIFYLEVPFAEDQFSGQNIPIKNNSNLISNIDYKSYTGVVKKQKNKKLPEMTVGLLFIMNLN